LELKGCKAVVNKSQGSAIQLQMVGYDQAQNTEATVEQLKRLEPLTIGNVYELDCIHRPVDRSEVIRYMGYPAGNKPLQRMQGAIDRWIPEAAKLAQMRAVYAVFDVAEIERRRLVLTTPEGKQAEFRGAIGEFLGMSKYVAVFVATAGPDIEKLANELIQAGDVLGGLIVNAVGSERAEAAELAALEQLRPQAAAAGLALTLPYSPGYCGMDVRQQIPLFSLMGTRPAGVELTENCLMRPIKSVSGLVGLGDPDEVTAFGSPCDRCDLKHCDMRRSFTPPE